MDEYQKKHIALIRNQNIILASIVKLIAFWLHARYTRTSGVTAVEEDVNRALEQ